MNEISYFFNTSTVRQNFLLKSVQENCLASLRTKLLDVCQTRWVGCVDGLHVFQELFAATYNTLDNMAFVHLNLLLH